MPKSYVFISKKENKTISTNKGIIEKQNKDILTYENYEAVLKYEFKTINGTNNTMQKVGRTNMTSQELEKVAISNNDTKRVWFSPYESVPFGYSLKTDLIFDEN